MKRRSFFGTIAGLCTLSFWRRPSMYGSTTVTIADPDMLRIGDKVQFDLGGEPFTGRIVTYGTSQSPPTEVRIIIRSEAAIAELLADNRIVI